MISHWFSDQVVSEGKNFNGFFEMSGKDKNSGNELDKFDLIFMSTKTQFALELRKGIELLFNHYPNVKALDAGFLLNPDFRFILQPVLNCFELGKISFVTGGNQHLAKAFAHQKDLKITFVSNTMSRIEEMDENCSFLAYQRHMSDYKTLKFVEEFCPDSLSLGQMKSHPHLIEPILRDTEILYINLNALRSSEAPGSEDSWPSGLVTEELCQIVKFAGNSLRLKSVIIDHGGLHPSVHSTEAKLVAELYWYLLEGMRMRQSDHPIFNANISEYIVNMADFDTELVFIKSNVSQRWWLRLQENEQVPFISCAHEEYQQSIQNEIPERLLRYIV